MCNISCNIFFVMLFALTQVIHCVWDSNTHALKDISFLIYLCKHCRHMISSAVVYVAPISDVILLKCRKVTAKKAAPSKFSKFGFA